MCEMGLHELCEMGLHELCEMGLHELCEMCFANCVTWSSEASSSPRRRGPRVAFERKTRVPASVGTTKLCKLAWRSVMLDKRRLLPAL